MDSKYPCSKLALAIIAVALNGCAGHAREQRATPDRSHSDTALALSLTQQAVKSINEQKWADAQKLLQRALEADITLGQAHNDLGTVYLHQQNLYEAAVEFQAATRLMPERPEPRNNLGLVFETAGKTDEAIQWYDQALNLDPKNVQYIGNDVRARIRRGDKDARVKELLAQLLKLDDRPDWVQWARERLTLMGSDATTRPSEK